MPPATLDGAIAGECSFLYRPRNLRGRSRVGSESSLVARTIGARPVSEVSMRTRIIHLINPKTDSLTTRPLYLNRALYSPLAGLLAVAASIPRDQHAAISEQDLIGLAGLLCGRTALPPRTSTMSNGDRTLWGVCVASRLQEETEAILHTCGLRVGG